MPVEPPRRSLSKRAPASGEYTKLMQAAPHSYSAAIDKLEATLANLKKVLAQKKAQAS